MLIAVFILLMGAINRFRGSGLVSGGRWIASAVAGLATGYMQYSFHGYDWRIYAVGSIAGLGFFLGSVFGWGKYFSAFTGRGDKAETEIAWIEWIAYKLQPTLETNANWRRYGVICFTLRAMLYLPMFIALVLVSHNWLALIMSLSVLSMGVIYGAMRYLGNEKYAVEIAEVLFGMVLGLNIIICIV